VRGSRRRSSWVSRLSEVRARSVQFLADVVAGAMGEEFTEASRANDGTSRVVSLEAADRAVLGKGALDRMDGRIAGIHNRIED